MDIFNPIINKKEVNQLNSDQKSQLFENIILFHLENPNKEDLIIKIEKILEDKNILKNLFKKIHLFIINSEKYNKNKIGRLFKNNRIIKTIKEFGTKANINNKNNDFFFFFLII